jgi:hypothetical protein
VDFYEFTPSDGWAALRKFVQRPRLKQFSRLYIKVEIKYFYVYLKIQACLLATMVAKTAPIVVGGSPNITNLLII